MNSIITNKLCGREEEEDFA